MLCLLRSHGMFRYTDETPVSSQPSIYGKEKVGGHQWLWTKSNDTVIKGWILGSLSQEPLRYVLNSLTEKRDESNRRDQHNERDDQPADSDFSAKDVWDELQTIYGPSNKQEEELPYDQRTIFEAILSGNWEEVDGLLNNRSFKVTVVDKVANNGNTALHIAVGNVTDQEFLRKLLGVTPENTQLSNVQNSDGSTLLHVAAMVGDVIVAEMLVAREAALLFTKDKKHREWNTDVLSGISGDELLVILISSKQFEKANEWLKPLHKTRYYSDAVLMAIAQNFPSELNALEKYIVVYVKRTDIIHRRVKGILKTASDYMVSRCVPLCGSCLQKIFNSFSTGIEWIIMFFLLIPKMLERARVYNDAIKLLNHVCSSIHDNYQPISEHHRYYKDPIFEATRQNAYEVVQQIVLRFPNAIWSANEDGHNIVQYAVINRSENVYNVLYQMNKHKNTYKTIKDPSQNNLLHLAARLAPASRLNLISGAALQVQHELKWFKEVKRFVSPLCITEKNSFGETPEMVFTREHKELVIEGEKWIKTTAESYTITVALITTIVFAAAITVPGGNNQDMGIPLFTNNPAFTIFAISDAISLFTAVTSLLIFLSILTTRFAQQDFLYKLPTKLMVGLVMLLTSTTAMIVAFGATLYLVFGQGNSKILIPIVVLTCLSIISFVILQFPLIRDLMTARFGRSIFGKKRDEPFY
ncbi:uncharacterized protein LOC128127077 isoform X2 [Lactuca sativa]|uniref:uncharacterized protein LOC111877534 isoform X2 n=1 Tax=Lactuca sativa TaxID=4236 RepID=UPI001C68EB8D|nr:uncharacterized protein LOC111877534 isoform X2 [Lactuca sativa]XP_052621373.1 uncharacterized protein LOC128127077 isoform X2 [Lactuca sativa]